MKNNSKSYKKRILTVYNLAILSYTVVGVVVFLYNMDSEKVSAGVKSNQQRKGELLHTFALSCPEQFKKLYGQQAYDDIRNSQINFLARNQIRDPFAVEKKGYHIIHNLNIQTLEELLKNYHKKRIMIDYLKIIILYNKIIIFQCKVWLI